MPTPGDQGERGLRRRGGGEAASLIVDEPPAIEAFPDLDAAAGVRAPVRAARDLDEARAQAHGVVAGHAARIAAAEALGQVTGGPAPDRRRLGGGLGQAAVVVREVGGEEGLGRVDRLDPVETEFGDEAIL